jgi:16S rRNA (cytosine967-C5)-methyltransferase
MSGIEFLSIGIIRFLNTIDFYVSKGSKPLNLKNLPVNTRNLLRIATYLFHWRIHPLDSIIDYLTDVDKQLVPIVTRIGRLENIEKYLEPLSSHERLSILTSHPTFLVKTLFDNLDKDETFQLLAENNNDSTTYLRPNLLNTSKEIIDTLNEMDGVVVEPDPNTEGIYKVKNGFDKIVISEPFVTNEVLVQDKASFLAARVVDPKPGDVVWDACAAPGMKTQLLWELMEQKGQLMATELNPKRFHDASLQSEARGVMGVNWSLDDASKAPILNAEKILIDAPCTSTGMLRSHPSFKWRLNKKVLFSLMTIQNKILEGILSAYSDSPGIEIVYATCSILPHEGESQIDSIIDRYPVELVEIPELDRMGYPDFNCHQSVRRLFPHSNDTDGFFIAKMRITH